MLSISIIIGYLLLTLVVGIYKGRESKDMKDYSVAGKHYSNEVMIATILATFIGGGPTMGATAKIYSVGIIYFVASLGKPINQLLMAQYFAPRMEQFSKMISVGDIMGSFYGKPGRVITGIAGALLCLGIVGAQVSALGYLFHFFFGISHIWGILIGAGIIVVYTSFGGIRAVTATDFIQFGILIVVIPMVSTVAFQEIGGLSNLMASVPATHFMAFPNKELVLQYLPIFFMFCIPYLNPAVTQRFLMAKNPHQIARALRISAVIEASFMIIIVIIGLCAVALFPNIDANVALLHLMNVILPPTVKGIAISGMLAVIMSTADSYLNAGGITLVHDAFVPLKKTPFTDKQELTLTKFITLALGLASILAAISFKSIIDIVLFFHNFWGPIVVVPLLAGIFGFRSNIPAFLISAITGSVTVVVWLFFIKELTGLDAQIPSLIASAIAFFGAHYLQGLHRKPPADKIEEVEEIKQFASVGM